MDSKVQKLLIAHVVTSVLALAIVTYIFVLS
jgi:hypothetical protein